MPQAIAAVASWVTATFITVTGVTSLTAATIVYGVAYAATSLAISAGLQYGISAVLGGGGLRGGLWRGSLGLVGLGLGRSGSRVEALLCFGGLLRFGFSLDRLLRFDNGFDGLVGFGFGLLLCLGFGLLL